MKSLIIILIVVGTLFSEIIPSINRIVWTPGIPSDVILDKPINMANVVDFGADNSGSTDALDAINGAINSISTDGGVLFFPAGTYKINGSIEINNSNITVKGEGADKSKLIFYNPTRSSCIEIVTYGRGDWQSVSGYSKDATTLSVADGSKFTVGEFAEIQQENDSSFMYTDPEWNQSYAQNVVGQFMEVTGINGNELTLKRPLHIGYQDKFSPEIRPQRLIKGVNIEDLYIEMKTDSDKFIILYKNAAYGAVRNIESYHTRKAHVASESTIGCEVTGSKFSRSYDYGGGGHGYGVTLGYHTTDWLVENNIFDSLRHAMIFSKGANGNVISYNYSQNVLQGSGETDLNDGWIPPDISSHGHYPYMNLIEGNSAQEVGISDYWGPSGPGNLYFRNRILSGETSDGISYYDVTTKQNIIGNSAIVIRDGDGKAFGNLEHGNVIDGTLLWNDTILDHTLPNSYYLTEKPLFFGTVNWPLYGPVEGFTEKLPAQIRFEGGTVSINSSLALNHNKEVLLSQMGTEINLLNAQNYRTVSIFSLNGRELFSKDIVGNSGEISIKSANLSAGSYVVQLSGATNFVQKILVR